MSREVIPDFSPYRSAPSSPNVLATDHTPQLMRQNFLHNTTFHTAPSSPANEFAADKIDDDSSSNSDDFEFETSRRFDSYIELDVGQDFEYCVEDPPQQQGIMKPKRESGGSLPSMAFADELFYNGLVMPLKPPPRLQSNDENASFGQGSIPPSPRSPQTSVLKVPFVHKAAWNDDFDPFKAALEKVSQESRRTSDASAGSHHRRTRSHSPLRAYNSMDKNFDQQILGPKFGLPKEPKGSPYARFVIEQNKQVEQNGKGPKKAPKFPFRKSVRSSKNDHEWTNKMFSKIEANGGNNILVVETGIKKIMSILLKYASFGRDNNDDKATNRSCTNGKSSFKKLGFKIKGHGSSDNEKKRGIDTEDSKTEVMEYERSKPSLALCFYGFEIHKNTNGQPIRRSGQ